MLTTQHDIDICVEKIEIEVFFKVQGGQRSQAPTSKPCNKYIAFV